MYAFMGHRIRFNFFDSHHKFNPVTLFIVSNIDLPSSIVISVGLRMTSNKISLIMVIYGYLAHEKKFHFHFHFHFHLKLIFLEMF